VTIPSLKTQGPLRPSPQRAGKAGGTTGYMAPESVPTAIDGLYPCPGYAWQKMDVFSWNDHGRIERDRPLVTESWLMTGVALRLFEQEAARRARYLGPKRSACIVFLLTPLIFCIALPGKILLSKSM